MRRINTDITNFLKDKTNDVVDGDLEALATIVNELIDEKWERDEQGDRKIEFHVVDRTTTEPLPFIPLPRLQASMNSEEKLNEYVGLAAANVRLALENLTNALKIRDAMVKNELEKAANG